MKPRLLDLLACPECRAFPLALETYTESFTADMSGPRGFGRAQLAPTPASPPGTNSRRRSTQPTPSNDPTDIEQGDEIDEGLLLCPACRRQYPIIAGVPRLLPDALIGALVHYHPDFFARYPLDLPGQGAQDEVARTLTFYSYARAKLFTPQVSPELLTYWQRSLAIRIPGSQHVGGKLVLDAGCGEGRYTYCLAEAGAEVVGMDLSEAVNLAQLRNRANPRAHVVQASIYRPPFRPGAFEVVMSTGVLHHLPDPEAGFRSLLPLLHPGGSIQIWVYGLQQMSLVYRLSHLTFLRGLGRKLSPRASYLLSVPLGLGLNLLLLRPVRLLARTRRGSRLPVQLRELASLPLRMHIAEVQDRIGVPVTHYLTGEELRAWCRHAGLEEVSVEPTHGGRGWSLQATRGESAEQAHEGEPAAGARQSP